MLHTGIVNRKAFVRMSHAERCHYDAFVDELMQQSCSILAYHTSSTSRPSHTILPSHLAAVVYSMAVLGAQSEQLAAAVTAAAAGSLQQAAAAAADEAAATVAAPADAATAAPPSAAATAAAAVVAAREPSTAIAGWTAADVSSLMWGLGTLGHTPPPAWLHDMLALSRQLLPRCVAGGWSAARTTAQTVLLQQPRLGQQHARITQTTRCPLPYHHVCGAGVSRVSCGGCCGALQRWAAARALTRPGWRAGWLRRSSSWTRSALTAWPTASGRWRSLVACRSSCG